MTRAPNPFPLIAPDGDPARPSRSGLLKSTLTHVITWAAWILVREGLEKRIDLFRTVTVPDPVASALKREHAVRVRVRITATSLLFGDDGLADTPVTHVIDAKEKGRRE